MVHAIVGIAALALGIWTMSANWMIFAEVAKLLLFLGLVVFGVVAVLAGVRRLRAPNTKRPATESAEFTEDN